MINGEGLDGLWECQPDSRFVPSSLEPAHAFEHLIGRVMLERSTEPNKLWGETKHQLEPEKGIRISVSLRSLFDNPRFQTEEASLIVQECLSCLTNFLE